MSTTSRRALVGHTLHTPSGFLVFNAGKVTKNIPTDLVPRLERDGIIATASTQASKPAANKPAARKSGGRKSGGAKRSAKQEAAPPTAQTSAADGAPPAE